MTYLKRLLTALLASSFLLSANVHAGDHKSHKGPDHFIKHMMKKLDLTDSQHDAISELQQALKAKKKAHKQEMMEIHKGMKQQVLSDNADISKIEYYAHQKALLVEKMTIAKAKTMHKIYNELINDQQQKMRRMMEKRHKKMHDH